MLHSLICLWYANYTHISRISIAIFTPSGLNHTTHRFIRHTIILCDLTERFTLLDTSQHQRPFRMRYLPLRVIRPTMSLHFWDVLMKIHRSAIFFGRNQDASRDKSQWRPKVRCPSVPPQDTKKRTLTSYTGVLLFISFGF